MKEARQELRQTIQKAYYDLVGSSLDSKSVSYWERSILSKDKSMDDFLDFVTSMPEYKSLMKSKFANMYYDIIGYDLDNDVVDLFLNGQCKKRAVSLKEMRKYITSLPMFYEKYTDLVKNVFLKTYDHVPDDNVIDFYLTLIKQTEDYNLDRLYDDMARQLHEHPEELTRVLTTTHDTGAGEEEQNGFATNDFSNSNTDIVLYEQENSDFVRFITHAYQNLYQTRPSEQLVHKIKELYYNPVKLILFLQGEDKTLSRASVSHDLFEIDYKHLGGFEQVFERPMYVHEYFKYVIRNKNRDALNYQQVFEDFMTKFTRLRSIVKNFLNEVLDEYEFVQNYLYDADDPNFFDTFVDNIVQSKKYKENMHAYLAHLYNQIFQESLEQRDVEYIFEKVYQQKLSFKDECLNDILTSFKTETENIISHIFEQFTYVLHRNPDVFEINDFVSKYRDLLKQHTIEEVDIITEKSLMESLEFHDILKERIREKKPDILPRMLFAILSDCLRELPSETIESIENKIHSLTQA